MPSKLMAPSPATGRVPRGPNGYPVIGSLLDQYRDPLGFTERVAAQYGKVSVISLAGLPFHLVTGPELIEEVLVSKGRDFSKGSIGYDRRLLFGKGLATSDGQFFLRQRRLMQLALH